VYGTLFFFGGALILNLSGAFELGDQPALALVGAWEGLLVLVAMLRTRRASAERSDGGDPVE